jgi:hypothetical protein
LAFALEMISHIAALLELVLLIKPSDRRFSAPPGEPVTSTGRCLSRSVCALRVLRDGEEEEAASVIRSTRSYFDLY